MDKLRSTPDTKVNDGSGDKIDASGSYILGVSMNQEVAVLPCEKNATSYNMCHRRRGIALILNHKHFESRLGLKTRNGTDADKENLRITLRELEFEVHVYDDLSFRDIEKILDQISVKISHHDADCLFIAALSHGEGGILYASDQAYKSERLWSQFTGDKCPTLVGKPKLFFIQACQGDQLDSGVQLKRRTEMDSNGISYKIPTQADFLIAYSTVPGFYSWRNTTSGSWFVQALCNVLRQEGCKGMDLLSCLTIVNRKVAFDFQSNVPGDREMHEKKQIPCIMSMLTRDVIFAPKLNK